MSELREVFADFALLGERSGFGLSVPLSDNSEPPLYDGERVLLIEWGQLCAEGTVQSVESDGRRYWYGLLESRSAIRILDSGASPSKEQAASAPTGSRT